MLFPISLFYKSSNNECVYYLRLSSIYCSLCIIHSNICSVMCRVFTGMDLPLHTEKAVCYPSILFNYIRLYLCHRWVRINFLRPDKSSFKSQPYPSSLYDLIQIIWHLFSLLFLIYIIVIKIPVMVCLN